MRKSLFLSTLLSAGIACGALAQAPAGYVSLEEVEIEPPAATSGQQPVIGWGVAPVPTQAPSKANVGPEPASASAAHVALPTGTTQQAASAAEMPPVGSPSVSATGADGHPGQPAVASATGPAAAPAASTQAAQNPSAEPPSVSDALSAPAAQRTSGTSSMTKVAEGATPAAASNPQAAAVSTAGVETSKATAVSPPQGATAPGAPAAVFEARNGASFRDTLQAWSRMAGWKEVVWKLPPDVDYTLGLGGAYEGDYMDATRSFVEALGCETQFRVLFNPTTKVTLVEPV